MDERVALSRYGVRMVGALLAVSAASNSAQEIETDADWSVENLGPAVNSRFRDRFSVVTSDGLSLYFASNRPTDGSEVPQPWDIYVAWRDSVDEPFGEAVNIGPVVNSPYDDHSASLSPDGLTMYFASERPGGCGAQDLYISRRTDPTDHLSWSEPENLGCEVNSEFDESCPLLSGDPETNLALLYFVRNDVPGEINYDLYITQFVVDSLEFEPPLPLLELNTPEHDGHFDPNHGLIWSQREGGHGGGDIWLTSWIEEFFGWQQPENLGTSINTAYNEELPSVSQDGALYFPSNRPGGLGREDIYVARRTGR